MRNSWRLLYIRQKVRIVRELLSGATVGDEETAILELLEANKGEAPAVIAGTGWEWPYNDLDDHEQVLFIRKLRPVLLVDSGPVGQARGGLPSRQRDHELEGPGGDHDHER